MLRHTMLAAVGIVAISLAAADAHAQGPGGGSLPFSNVYKRPSVSPYTMLGNTGFGNVNNQTGGINPLVYQQLVQPQIQQQEQQIEQLRQRKQIGGLSNQVQQIQRNTQMRQVDETIRPTGHASTFQNLSHFYPQR